MITVATGTRFQHCAARLAATLEQLGEYLLIQWKSEPKGTPPGVPYAFKVTALEAAWKSGITRTLWLDSSIVPLRSLIPIWEHIEKNGYWFSENHHAKNGEWTSDKSRHVTNADWTCEEAYPILGITPDENSRIKHLVGTAFGLDMRNDNARGFLGDMRRMMLAGAFNGPYETHRHDQTVMSVIAHRRGMIPTVPPLFFTDGGHQTQETILVAERGCRE